MDISIANAPGNAAARIKLQPGETCVAEAGAMIAMSGDISITTTTYAKQGAGGVMAGLKRMVGGESFFVNLFTAGSNGGELWLATTLPGDMSQHELRNETLIVQGGSFVAAEHGIAIDTGWQGFKTLLSGEHMFWLHLRGTGKLVINSFGAIFPLEVGAEEVIVDSGHIVAFQETLNFSITKAGKSWVSSFLGGEGLVCRFKGRGTVWCQSHNPTGFGRLLGPMLRPR